MRAMMPRKGQQGGAVIEAVVATPFLLLLMLVAAEVTNAFVDHNTLTKAVRSGARHLSANAALGTTGTVVLTPELIAEAQSLVVYGNPTPGGAPRLPGLTVGDIQVIDLGGNVIQLTASYAYTGILGATLPGFGFGSDGDLTHNLEATVSMRAL
ncbi:MAG: pilus assembly protein [Chromatiales bacterium]|nr:pilus assembly protein [Chromatiales bacterium]